MFPPRHVRSLRNRLVSGLIGLFAAAFTGLPIAAAAPPGAPIVNQAFLNYENAAGQTVVASSNTVEVIAAVLRSPSSLRFNRVSSVGDLSESVGPSSCLSGGAFVPLPDPPDENGNPLDPTVPRTLSQANGFNLGETIFVRLDDQDQNVDFQVIDVATVSIGNPASGDSETIQLSETGPNTGIFAGYLPSGAGSPVANDCVLQGTASSSVLASYTDPADAADQATASSIVDPTAVVFDSQSGLPVDGVGVRLINADTGSLASVFGSDGNSVFPAELVSGQSVTDSGGQLYDFGSGEYRFPVVPPGNYRLEFLAPAGFVAPSARSIDELQSLPNAPFDLAEASFSNDFNSAGNDPFSFDVPVDPQSGSLFVAKSTPVASAAPGDFVRFDVAVENTSATDVVFDVNVTDQLPRFMRYVAGSATLDGETLADPTVDSTGTVMEFGVGNIGPGALVRVGYVVEIVGGQRNQELVNTAFARSEQGFVSNIASTRLRLEEDLFRSVSTLVGRVVDGSCATETHSEDRGVAGVRVFLQDGRYAVSDQGGRFHFEAVRPGRHVAQLDTATVPDYYDIVGCDEQGRFAGRPDSQIVDVSPGALMRADFYLRQKAPPEGRIDLSLRNRGTGDPDEVSYELNLLGTGNIDITDVSAMIMLPDGVRFRPNSMEISGLGRVNPRIVGQSLNITLDDRAGNWESVISFIADIDPAVSGDLVSKAMVTFSTPVEAKQRTPIAETLLRREAATWNNAGYVLNLKFGVLSADLSAGDRHQLDELVDAWQGVEDIRISAVGHSDSTAISPRSRSSFADNYVLSRVRARAVAEYLADLLDVAADDIQVEGRGPDDPVASNATLEGRSENRRVELILSGREPGKQSFLDIAQETSGVLVSETRGLAPGLAAESLRALNQKAMDDHLAAPQQLEAHVNSLRPGPGWVAPSTDFRPSIPAINVSVKHGLQQRALLFVNGVPAEAVNFTGVETNTAQTVSLSRWSGVGLVEGPNELVAEIRDAQGGVIERLTRSVHYAGTAVRGEIDLESSVLMADGRVRPLLAVRLYDRFGEPARHSSIGEFSIDAPYRSWWDVENQRENKLVQISKRVPLFTVGDNGLAYIELEPTSQSGRVTLRLNLANRREQELNAWLKPEPRDWIMVGFGEGTVGYNTLSNNAVAAGDAGLDEGYYDDGRLAFFAKGRVLGEYLLTLSYDSERDRGRTQSAYQTQIDPTRYYTLYGDNTDQRFEAPSQSKLYLKLEREQFNAMFGDTGSGLTTTDLARYERRMNGLKSEFNGRYFDYDVFATETDQAFVRDEIAGDGTSGLYELSSNPIVENSEVIRIETRDRFDPAVVLSTRTLTRYLDYILDVYDGTIFFKQPIPGRDEEFNPIIIVAEYETLGTGAEELIAGGRVAVHNESRTLEAGATYVSEQLALEDGELAGVDLRWQAAPATLVRAEIATSTRDLGTTEETGDAKMLSVEHRGDALDVRAEYREVDEQFGLGQQRTAEQGIRKFAVDGRYQVSESIGLRGQAAMQENLETGAERTVGLAEVQYVAGRNTANLKYTHAEDRFLDGDDRLSRLVTTGISRQFFDSDLIMRANASFDLGGDNANSDYATGYLVGFDYQMLERATLFVEHERAEGSDFKADMTRVGFRATPWQRAQFDSSISNEMSEFGPRLFANLGLVQSFQIDERWVIDLGVDQSRTLREAGERSFDVDRPPVYGTRTGDYVAGYVGALYQEEAWSANSRIEYRNGDEERRLSLQSGWYREPGLGHGLSAGLVAYNSDRLDGTGTFAAELRSGWAFRPSDSPWTLLHRADLRYEDFSLADREEQVWRLISNLNSNRRIGSSSQLALQYAFKYVQSNFDGTEVSGFTDLVGVDYSHGFRDRWEAGIHLSGYHAWQSGTYDLSAGVDLGFNIAQDMWLSVGYNITGFYDEDFADARYTAAGPFLRFTVRGHQELLKRVTGR